MASLKTAASTSGAWVPMVQGTINPEAQRVSEMVGETMDEVWSNGLYECQVRFMEPERHKAGALHLSIKRLDRGPERDWRHLQSIKNEVVGWEREALELYPAESRLVDNANQIHLWVMPAGVDIPFGYRERAVYSEDQIEDQMRELGIPYNGKARQRAWQPGLSTGPEFKP